MPRGKKGTGKPARRAQYAIFTEGRDGVLRRVGSGEGRNARDAVGGYLGENGDTPTDPLVIIPERNLTRVKADVETKTKVKLAKV